MRTNNALDEIAHVAGYTAARIIAAWYCGRRLYIPTEAREHHPLYALIGRSCLRALVRAYPAQFFRIPTDQEDARAFRDRRIAEALAAGASDATVATEYGLTSERVGQIRRALTSSGLLDYARLEPDAESGGVA